MDNNLKTNPSYYAVIPANVRYDNRLTANAKLLYGEISSLCNKDAYCWARNSYFAKLYGVSQTSVSKWISKLIECGYIHVQLIYGEGSKEILQRNLSLIPIEEKLKGGIEEKLNTPIEEKLKDNSTSINNTRENKLKNIKKENLLFPLKDLKQEEKKEKAAAGKFLFANSKFSKYDEVRSYLAANQSYRERYAGADLKEYIHAVGTWSDKKNVMTTDRGWIAHIRSFMDRDKEAGKLKMRAEKGKENKKVLEPHEALKLGVHTNF